MTNDPQLIHSQTTHHFFPCVGLGAPIAGISVSSGSSVTSCTNLASPFEDVPISGTIEWSNGAESDFEGLAKRERVEGTVVATTIGTVTYGLFAGYDLLRVTTTPNLDLAVCDEPGGLQETNGYTTLSILPPLL